MSNLFKAQRANIEARKRIKEGDIASYKAGFGFLAPREPDYETLLCTLQAAFDAEMWYELSAKYPLAIRSLGFSTDNLVEGNGPYKIKFICRGWDQRQVNSLVADASMWAGKFIPVARDGIKYSTVHFGMKEGESIDWTFLLEKVEESS